MPNFASPSELDYKYVNLEYSLSDTVITSFISQKSISYLDLQLCKLTVDSERKRGTGVLTSIFEPALLDKLFFCSEESLRNYLIPQRRFLYTLNLDFHIDREYSNRHDPESFYYNPDSLFITYGSNSFDYCHKVSQLVERAFFKTDSKIKLLKWIANIRPLEKCRLPRFIQIFYAKYLYSECVDSDFAMKCFQKFINFWEFSIAEDFKLIEYFLYHARISDFDVKSEKSDHRSLTDCSIQMAKFAVVKLVLRYEDRSYFCEKSYKLYNYRFSTTVSRKTEDRNKLRRHRIHQIFFIYFYCLKKLELKEDAKEALRLVWSSIPDSFVCLEEIQPVYGDLILPHMNAGFEFYKEAIRQTDIRPEPRSLSQYCRSTIRTSLVDNKHWLPEGIKQLKLPPRLETFLNLESDHLHPETFQDSEAK